MAELEDRLNAVLSNPQLMQQIMTMAQSMGAPAQSNPQTKPEPNSNGIDLAAIGKMANAISGSRVDANQRALLHALSPYVSRQKLDKLERAMRAAKLAGVAGNLLGNSVKGR